MELVDAVLALDAALENLSVVAALKQANCEMPILLGPHQLHSYTDCLCDTALGVVMGVVIALDPDRLRDDVSSPTITRAFLDERLAQPQAIQHMRDSIDIALADIDLKQLAADIETEFRRAAGATEAIGTNAEVPPDAAKEVWPSPQA